jgi:hypothetical protein
MAIVSAPIARAAVPGECGKSYAILMNGAQTSGTQADGTAALPGALTAAVGVGTISFSPDCSTITGELIFNAGDLQTAPPAESFGPAACLVTRSTLGTGVPCFDGGNHFTAASITSPGPNGNGSIDLQFSAGYTWLNGTSTTGSMPFEFTLQNGLGAATVFGTSTPIVAGESGPSPILTLTMQRIGTTTTGIPNVPTVYGALPYLGDSVMSCNSFSANLSDPFAMMDNSLEVAGSFGSAVGALQIFPTNIDPAAVAGGGSISFNSNDNFVIGSGVGKPVALRNDCPVQLVPQAQFLGSSQSQFADGASNAALIISGGSPTCTDQFPLAYLTSSVTWGSTDKNAYSIVTGAFGSSAFVIVPAGSMATCTLLSNGRTGSLTNSIAPATGVSRGPTAFIPIKVASTSPATCKVQFGPGGLVNTDGICALGISNTVAFVPGNSVSAVYANFVCVCSPGAPDSITETATVTSTCPMIGATAHTITCRN